MKFLLSTGIAYKTHTLKELENLALAEGYDGLELNVPPRHVSAEETNRDKAYGTVSTIQAIHAPGDVYDRPRFSNALKDTITLAQQLGTPLINIHPPTLSVGSRENVIRGIELIKKMEIEYKGTIAYEVLVNPYGLEPGRHAYFLEQQAYLSLEDYLADVKGYNLAATLDTAHLGTWNIQPHEFIPALGEHLKHVHLSDYSSKIQREHLMLGEGELDLHLFLKILSKSNPDITVTVELHPPTTQKEVAEALQKSMAYIQQSL
ncbi:MAG: sugar phosphate isomerase/epimerase [bacterium]|nr:sugar phosphate isomerase/epimerase [bacterium]